MNSSTAESSVRERPRVLVDPFGQSAVAAVYVWVDHGSADEPAGLEGAAHFVEHMLFKGTASRPLEQLAGAIEGMGGDINAYTTYECTVLHATVPNDCWAMTLEVLLDMALHPVFDPQEIERERAVILEEMRGGDDDPASTLADAVAAKVFTTHPYGRPVIGTQLSVQGLSRQDLVDFHARGYRAGNLLISVSGDVDPQAVQSAVDALIEPQAALERSVRPVEPPQKRARSAVISERFDEPLIELGFPGVDAVHPQAAALDLLLAVLAGSAASVLGTRLELSGLVSDTWGISETERDLGMLLLGCAPLKGKSEQCVREIALILSELSVGEHLSVGALMRAKAQILAERRFTLETVDGRAHDRVWYAAMTGDPDGSLAYRTQIAACTVEQLRVAASYLRPARCTLGVLSPKAGVAEGMRGALRELPPVKRAPRQGALIVETLDNGLRVVLEPLDSPLVAVRVAMLGGQRAERPSSAGAGELWARSIGAPGLSTQELTERLDLAQGSLGAFTGRQSQGLRCEMPAERLDLGLELLSAMVSSPTFELDERLRGQAELQHELTIIEDDPAACASRALRSMLLGPHPAGAPIGGTRRSLARMGDATLRRLHRMVVVPERMVLALSGGLDPERTMRLVRRLFGGLSGSGALPELPAPAPQSHARRSLELDREQAHVMLGWPGPAIYTPHAPGLQLAVSCLNGQGGRLFMELRERRGWAYQVGASAEEGLDYGVLSAHIAVAPELVERAKQGLLEVMMELARSGPTPQELQTAKRVVLTSRARSRQRASSRVMELAHSWLYGQHPQGTRERADAVISACTAAEVQIALQQSLSGPRAEVLAGGLT